jgi:hypothetical protein
MELKVYQTRQTKSQIVLEKENGKTVRPRLRKKRS